jgi:hypothetical protein
MSAPNDPSSAPGAGPRPTLATAALPRRVRRVLDQAYNLVSEVLARDFHGMLEDFEQQLFRLADNARNAQVQGQHLDTLRVVRLNRADLLPRYLLALEGRLATLRVQPATPQAAAAGTTAAGRDLRLVEDTLMDEQTLLHSIATRHEGRASLPLYLLGQRFGVLAGSPAFDPSRIPLGPRALCECLAEASQGLNVSQDARELLFRTFDRMVMSHYAGLAETLNALFSEQGVLPGLTHVPLRSRPNAAAPAEPGKATTPAAADASGDTGGDGQAGQRRGVGGGRSGPGGGGGRGGGADGNADGGARDHQAAGGQFLGGRAYTAWFGQTDGNEARTDEAASSALLQQLLDNRRGVLGKLKPGETRKPSVELGRQDVMGALDGIQRLPPSPTGSPRTILDIKQAILAQARQMHGKGVGLMKEDADTFELLGMLYGQISRELRVDAPANGLLARLQVPVLRAALDDRAFFVRPQHPARQLLNTVAESGARWLADDEADPHLLLQMRHAVDHVVEHYNGDAKVFGEANRVLQDQVDVLARKAEVSERRHVEAARGKERLELAKRRAGEVIADSMREKRLPKFVQALLNQSWADVLTLTMLRHGEGSEEWKQMQAHTARIIAATSDRHAPSDTALATQIEKSLLQVGYHADEADAIAKRLSAGIEPGGDDPASRTELTMKIKARARLGESNVEQADKKRKPKLPPRSTEEQNAYEMLRTLPFGTWIEFATNQQGDLARRRLSWYSPITDNVLFVNQRGQRVGEQTMDSLARMVAAGQARVVTANQGRLIDRAWQATLNALRNFAGHGKGAAPQEMPA